MRQMTQDASAESCNLDIGNASLSVVQTEPRSAAISRKATAGMTETRIFQYSKWRGKTRSRWESRGCDHDTFTVLRMRGGHSRLRILESLSLPKTRNKLSGELGMNWKTIGGHVKILTANDLIKELVSIGTSRYFVTTEKGTNVISLVTLFNRNAQ